MTPFELNIYADAYSAKLQDEHKNNIIHAYLTSRWVWVKKVDINKYLNSRESKIMTDDEMLRRVKQLNNIFGGNVKQGCSR